MKEIELDEAQRIDVRVPQLDGSREGLVGLPERRHFFAELLVEARALLGDERGALPSREQLRDAAMLVEDGASLRFARMRCEDERDGQAGEERLEIDARRSCVREDQPPSDRNRCGIESIGALVPRHRGIDWLGGGGWSR